jgi:hypothetical protein
VSQFNLKSTVLRAGIRVYGLCRSWNSRLRKYSLYFIYGFYCSKEVIGRGGIKSRIEDLLAFQVFWTRRFVETLSWSLSHWDFILSESIDLIPPLVWNCPNGRMHGLCRSWNSRLRKYSLYFIYGFYCSKDSYIPVSQFNLKSTVLRAGIRVSSLKPETNLV